MYPNIKTTGVMNAVLKSLRTLPVWVAGVRPGISATLFISFSLVAVLAVTANLVAEHGGWIITIQEQASVETPIFPVTRTKPFSGNRDSSPAQDATTVITPTRLLSAIERFERLTL